MHSEQYNPTLEFLTLQDLVAIARKDPSEHRVSMVILAALFLGHGKPIKDVYETANMRPQIQPQPKPSHLRVIK